MGGVLAALKIGDVVCYGHSGKTRSVSGDKMVFKGIWRIGVVSYGFDMTVFTVVITRETAPDSFKERVEERFADNHKLVIPNVWLVAGRGSSHEISDRLGISDGSVGNGVVSSISGYYGRAPTDLWDWILAKWEETSSSE
jgi:hypothetical protein